MPKHGSEPDKAAILSALVDNSSYMQSHLADLTQAVVEIVHRDPVQLEPAVRSALTDAFKAGMLAGLGAAEVRELFVPPR